MLRSDRQGWFASSLLVVGAITALRWILLAFDRTDLFVDEAQYWLWGQNFAFGYYSKPPLIAWLIGAITTLANSDAQFWIRMPGAALHGLTALMLGACAARLDSPRAAFWVTVTYVTLPFAALGSLLISTDSVMAPFFAGAIYFYLRLVQRGRWQDAVLAGVMLGMACLAKYAGVYFLIGVVVAAIFNRDMRPSLSQWALLLISFVMVLSPNFLWNVSHQFATVGHTLDNVGWVEDESPMSEINLWHAPIFLISQIGVFGPVTMLALIWGFVRRKTAGLGALIIPVIVIVTLQAILDEAYANWALSAYFAGTIVAGMVLVKKPRWMALSLVVNGAICLLLPILTIYPDTGTAGKPWLSRYLGRAELSETLIALAQKNSVSVIVTGSRDVIADLFYTGRNSGLQFYALNTLTQPENHYEQVYSVPLTMTQTVLYVGRHVPLCAIQPVPLTLSGNYAKSRLQAYFVAPPCLPLAD